MTLACGERDVKRTGPLLTEETKTKRGEEKEERKKGKGDEGRKGIRDGAERKNI